jgi:hypothetical protein
VKRDWDKGAQDELLDGVAAAAEQAAQAAGDGGQQDVVHRRAVGVGDALHQLKPARTTARGATRADRAVQAGRGGTPLGEGFAYRRPGAADPAHCAGGVGQPRQEALEPVHPPAQGVVE